MTQEHKANIILFITIFVSLVAGGILYYFQPNLLDNLVPNQIPEHINDPKNISWEIWPKPIDTVVKKPIVKENFDRMVNKWNYFSFAPPKQPILSGSYNENTAQMISYMKQNALKIQLNKTVSEGYLYFKIKSNWDNNGLTGKLFIFIYNGKISGYIDSKTAIYSFYKKDEGVWELIFDAKNIGILEWGKSKTTNVNILNYLSYYWTKDYISTFWVSQKASTIENIYFAYEL